MDTNDISLCEKLVMKTIWDSPEDLALQEVLEKVNEENGRKWKPQTVSTFLARLVKKGFISAYRKGRYSFYQPVVSKAEFLKATVEENAKFFAEGDMAEYACNLCDDILTDNDLERLKRKIDELS